MAFQFLFPDIGEGIHEGKVIEIYVKEGDKVEEGQNLLKVETDKVVTDIPSPRTGTISKILCKEEEIIFVESVIFEIDTGEGAEAPAADKPVEAPKAAEAPKAEAVEEKGASVIGEIEVVKKGAKVMASSMEHEQVAPGKGARGGNGKALATPVARKMAKDLGVDINRIKGSGPQGRVMKSDIQTSAQSQGGIAPTAATTAPAWPTLEGKRESFSMIRNAIAEQMTRALQIPHFALHEEIEASELMYARDQYIEKTGNKISYVAFFIKVVANALRQFPKFNASIDMAAKEVVYHPDINVGCAVDTDRGLMVPIVRNADQLSIAQIHDAIRDLSERARNQTIKLDEIKGGTFTVTSVGSIAGTKANPVINVPEVAILGLGRIRKAAVMNDEGEVGPGYMLDMSLVCDHRLIDGAEAARFLKVLTTYLENPLMMLIEQ